MIVDEKKQVYKKIIIDQGKNKKKMIIDDIAETVLVFFLVSM